ncbi:Cell cycle checkpoint protein rad17 [Orbilia oligospora]|uniref:Cell cycle checkpoint protein rad17 n=1 Tax=Orbilia oligospora TaxID=2813651 RepID=A0A7C8RFA3_ORBOL|nr:Cell cycle checkpoint protein rad17 [Orbilia oligospora]
MPMARPRKLRIISSDDEDDQLIVIASSENEQQTAPTVSKRSTRSTRASTAATTNVTTNTSVNTSKSGSSRAKVIASSNGISSGRTVSGTQTSSTTVASRSSKSKTSSSTSVASPRKPSSSSSKLGLGASKQGSSITSFFAPATQTSSQAPKKIKRAPSKKFEVEEIQEYEEVDGIEFSSDEDSRRQRRRQVVPIISSEPDELPRKVPPASQPKPSQRSMIAQPKLVKSDEPIETKTWADKYAPTSTADLAVHKRKVDDVKSWLEAVFRGVSSKRLLVLSGPSGTGKTATITALASELDFDILRWENPSQHDIGGDGIFESLNAKFEEFMGRGMGYGALPLVVESGSRGKASSKQMEDPIDPDRRKVILLEDLPNIFSSSSAGSAAMMSFRGAIHNFLATPQDGELACILIISENLTTQSNATSITPHRLLGPQLLNHRGTTSITFNKIAAGIMQKALEKIVDTEMRMKGIKETPSPGLLAGIGACGDIRSAINTLEFMMVGRGKGSNKKLVPMPKTKRKIGRSMSDWGQPSESEKLTLELITQREASLGIFHAVGKIVWNKRFDPSEPQFTPPEILPDPPYHLSSFSRSPSLVDISTLIDTAGVDLDTFVSGIHENYLHSCAGASFPENYESCIEHLSDSDMLSRNTTSPWERNQVEDAMRQGELAFQVAVRGILMGLPAKVKRDSTKNSMYYPMSQRLWRDKEVVEGLLSVFISNGLANFGNSKIAMGMADLEALLEYLPYTHRVGKARMRNSGGLRTPAMKNLEKIVLFRGVGDQSEVIPDGPDDEEEVVEGEEDERGNVRVKKKVRRQKEETGQYGGRFKKRQDGGVGIAGVGEREKHAVEEGMEGLVLEEDDIEDSDS